MNTTLQSPDDELTNFASDSATAAATLDTDDLSEAAPAARSGPCCEKCEAPFKSDLVSVCSRCGWYASLKQFVEVDQSWEVYHGDHEQPAPTARPSHLEVWLAMIPPWGWVVVATLAAVVVESVAVRLITTDGSSFRTSWSLAQLAIGLLAFVGLHIFNFLTAAAEDADFGALDVIMRPVKLWLRAFRNLPERLWVTDGAASGLMAVLMSVVVIGGLPYERLWDWGIEKPTNQNLMGAVVSRMQQMDNGKGADSLEDAVADFAGSQNVEPGDGKPAPPAKPRQKIDCVIVGYRVDTQGQLQSLVLGTAYKDKLVYACSVLPQLSSRELAELMETLAAIPASQPFLTVQVNAHWVEPRYSCRVSFETQDKTGRLIQPQWDEMLGKLGIE